MRRFTKIRDNYRKNEIFQNKDMGCLQNFKFVISIQRCLLKICFFPDTIICICLSTSRTKVNETLHRQSRNTAIMYFSEEISANGCFHVTRRCIVADNSYASYIHVDSILPNLPIVTTDAIVPHFVITTMYNICISVV